MNIIGTKNIFISGSLKNYSFYLKNVILLLQIIFSIVYHKIDLSELNDNILIKK